MYSPEYVPAVEIQDNKTKPRRDQVKGNKNSHRGAKVHNHGIQHVEDHQQMDINSFHGEGEDKSLYDQPEIGIN